MNSKFFPKTVGSLKSYAGSIRIALLSNAHIRISCEAGFFMLNRKQKEQIVKQFSEELKDIRGGVLTSFEGLPTKAIQELRATLSKDNVKYKVIKLSLLKRILDAIGIDTSPFNYQVPLALSFSQQDEIAPAKLVTAFAKKHEQLKVAAGILDKKLIDAGQVRQLAALPGKQELRGQVVMTVAAPLRGLVSVLSGNMRGLLNVLNAKIKVQNAK